MLVSLLMAGMLSGTGPVDLAVAAASAADGSSSGQGYRMVDLKGAVSAFGDAQSFGSVSGLSPIVGIASTPTGQGYWVADATGRVKAFGDAPALSAALPKSLPSLVVDIAGNPAGGGFWLLDALGRVTGAGTAKVYGSLSGVPRSPVLGMAATPSGRGYWVVTANGQVSNFGDAPGLGSVSPAPAQPVVRMAATPTGGGYWIVTANGHVYNFGDAQPFGSLSSPADVPVSGIGATPSGKGYWLMDLKGRVSAFGDAASLGSKAGGTGVVAFASTPPGRLSIRLSADSPVAANGVVRYVATVANTGQRTVRGVAVKQVLPSDGTFLSATPTATPSSGSISFPLADLPPNGSATTVVQWRAPPTPTTLSSTATVTAGNAPDASAKADVVVQPGPAATRLALTAPAATTSGSPFDVTVTAQDAAGKPVAGYTGTVTFAADTPGGALPADYAFTAADAGTHRFTATLRTAGTTKLTVTDTHQSSLTAAATVAVRPGGLDHFGLAVVGSQTAGAPFTVSVTAYDAAGNITTDYTGIPALTGTLGSASGCGSGCTPGYALDKFTAGVATAHVTGYKAETGRTLTVSDGSTTVTSNPFDVAAAGVRTVTLAPATATITAGATQAFTAQGTDPYGNPLGDVTAATTFSIAPDGSCAGASCTAGTPGPHTVTGTDGPATGTAAVTVTSGALDHFGLAVVGSQTAGAPFTVSVTAYDAAGNIKTDYTGTPALTGTLGSTGGCGSGCTPGYALDKFTAGVATAHVTAYKAETGRTLTVTDGPTTVTSNPFDVAAAGVRTLTLAPATATITAGATQAFTAQGTDPYGNPLGDVTAATTFSIAPDGSCAGASCTAGTPGPHTVTGTDGPATGTAAVTVTSGALDHFGLAVVGSQTAGAPFTVSVTAYDAAGNIKTDYTGTPALTGTLGGTGGCDPTCTPTYQLGVFRNGAALGTVTAYRAATSETLTVTDGAIHGVSNGFPVTPGSVHDIALNPASSTMPPGQAQAYTAIGTDMYGNTLGDVTAATTFTIAPDGSCAAASCTATTTGQHTVTGTDGTVTATATLTVDVYQAPPLDTSHTTTTADDLAFLYTGPHPVQVGVADGTIKPAMASGIRGTVRNSDGTTLSGATVIVADHPEYGQTVSQADGSYALAVNGGAVLTIDISTPGRLPVQRTTQLRWQDWAHVDDVVLLPVDSNVSSIDLTAATPIQVARGSVVHDGDGTRQATLLFPAGTTADMVMPDGSSRPVSTLHVRATEVTVGDAGPSALPGELPATSAYTYAVDFNADEAITAGADTIRLNHPAIGYVEDFLGYRTGILVPSGTYSRSQHRWIAGPNGVVVQILSITGGAADVDTTGNGTADNTGIDINERRQLAQLYTPGTKLWRVPVPELTDPDWNWPYTLPDGAIAPPPQPPDQPSTDGECHTSGSDIGCESQSLGEHLAIPGTDFTLDYASDHQSGYADAFSFDIPYGPTDPKVKIPPNLVADIQIVVAGRDLSPHGNGVALPFGDPTGITVATNDSYHFTWDGLDAFGRRMQGTQRVSYRVGYRYKAVLWQAQSSSGIGASGPPIFGGPAGGVVNGVEPLFTRKEIEVWSPWVNRTVGLVNDDATGLGGWTLSGTRPYDIGLQTQQGGGRSLVGERSTATLHTIAGTGAIANTPDGVNAATSPLGTIRAMTRGPDGTVYIAESGSGNDPYSRIRTVSPTGRLGTLAGTTNGFADGPGTSAKFGQIQDLALAPDGSLWVADWDNSRVRRVTPDGTVSTIAGTGTPNGNPPADGTGALQGRLQPNKLAIAPDGTAYVADANAHRIYRLGTDGKLYTHVGPGNADQGLGAIALGPDGTLYYGDFNSLRKIDPTGTISTVIASSGGFSGGDGGPAAQATIQGSITGLAVGPDGSIYLSEGGDSAGNHIRLILPSGTITTVVGIVPGTQIGNGGFVEGYPARGISITPGAITVLPDDSVAFAEGVFGNNRVVKVTPALPGVTLDQFTIASPDASTLTAYDAAGRPQTVYNALTGGTIASYTYDPQGRILTATTPRGTLTITRDSSGQPTEITAPGGHALRLQSDGNQNLVKITDEPTSRTIVLSTTGDGLLTSLTDPGGTHSFTYNVLGRLTKDVDPDGRTVTLALSRSAISRTVSVSINGATPTTHRTDLNADGSQTSTLTAPGQHAQTVTQNGALVTATTPEGVRTQESFAADPRFGMQSPLLVSATSTEPGGRTITETHSRVVTLTNPANPLSVTTLTESTTGPSGTTTTTFQAADRSVTVRTPAGSTNKITVDGVGRVITAQEDPTVTASRYHYDTGGNLDQLTVAGSVTTYTYDADGRVLTATDAAGRVQRYAYDDIHRTVTTTSPAGRQYVTSEDSAGTTSTLRTPQGGADTSTSTTHGELISFGIAGQNPLTVTLDANGLPASTTLPSGTVLTDTRNAAGQLTQQSGGGAVDAYAYNDIGQTTTVSHDPGGGGTINAAALTWSGLDLTHVDTTGTVAAGYDYTYDNQGRLASYRIAGQPAQNLQRNADGLLTIIGPATIDRKGPAGAATTITDGARTETRSYDGNGRLASRNVTVGAFTYGSTFTYDNTTGQLTGQHETTNGSPADTSYAYDPDGWLTGVTAPSGSTTYTYDGDGNRLTAGSTAATFDAADHLTSHNGAACTSDANGNLTSCDGNTYTYDTRGHLASASTPTGTINYSYDASGRLIARTDSQGTTQYLYANPALTLQVSEIRTNAQTLTFDYDDQGRVIAFHDGASVKYVVTDPRGTPIDFVDPSGALTNAATRDAFGNPKPVRSPISIGFSGGIEDPATGLVTLGARTYDPALGRWLQPDPALLSGTDANLYRYSAGDPVNLTDPTGLIFEDWQDWNTAINSIIYAGFRDKTIAAPAFGVSCPKSSRPNRGPSSNPFAGVDWGNVDVEKWVLRIGAAGLLMKQAADAVKGVTTLVEINGVRGLMLGRVPLSAISAVSVEGAGPAVAVNAGATAFSATILAFGVGYLVGTGVNAVGDHFFGGEGFGGWLYDQVYGK